MWLKTQHQYEFRMMFKDEVNIGTLLHGLWPCTIWIFRCGAPLHGGACGPSGDAADVGP